MYTLYDRIYGAIENDELDHLKFSHEVVKKDGEVIEQEWIRDFDGKCPLDDLTVRAFLSTVKTLNDAENTGALQLVAKVIAKMIEEEWDENWDEVEYL